MTVVNIPISANDQDGYGWQQDNTWANIVAGTGTFVNSSGETVLTPNKAFFSPTYYAQVAFLRFNTSSIPGGSTINSAKLQLYFTAKSITNLGFKMVGDYYDFGGEPTIAADWVLTSSPSIFTALDPASVTTGVVTDITLTTLSGINPGGTTGIRITMDTNSGTTPTGSNYMQFAAYDNATLQEPRLEVDYTAGGGGATRKDAMLMGVG